MKLENLIQDLEILDSSIDPSQEITGISYDSRKIKPGNIFVAIKGTKKDGHKFIGDAIRRGAACIILESEDFIKDGISFIKVRDTREALSRLSKNFFNPPLEDMNIIGITGTNGKTTTSYLIESILRSSGRNVGVIGTIAYRFSGRHIKADMTTPESLELMKLLRDMADEGIRDVVMEVSSHSLSQGRVKDCPFKIAVFTNITRDHLDYHGSIRSYFDAKKRLFLEYDPEFCVINRDDPYGEILIKEIRKEKLVTYGLEDADIVAKDIEIDKEGIKAEILLPDKEKIKINSKLIGRFNLYNLLASVSACYLFGIGKDEIEEGVSKFGGVPGRMELIKNGDSPYVIVDYAHTPDALLNVIKTIKDIFQARIITVFGCGGERDKGKREIMGRIAGSLSDLVIITSDNPRSEDPYSIMKQIEKGVKSVSENYLLELDRKEAIRKAIEISKKEDVILVAGKGHEDYQIIGNKRIPFEDRGIVKELLKEYAKC